MQAVPRFSWQSLNKQWAFSTKNYGFSHLQEPWQGQRDAEMRLDPQVRQMPSGLTVVLSPFCKPTAWWRALLEAEGRRVLPVFFHRGRLFCGPLLRQHGAICPTCVALRLAQGFPHREVLLSVMTQPITCTSPSVLEEMWQTAQDWIEHAGYSLADGHMLSGDANAPGDTLSVHSVVALPGRHPDHCVQAAYEPLFVGEKAAYTIPFSPSQPTPPRCIDKYVGPLLVTLPANEFPGEPQSLKGYVTTVGYLGQYTKWAPDVTGAGMAFGAEGEWASIGEAVERYSGNFIPETLPYQSEQHLQQEASNFLSQALFRPLSAAQEAFYADRLAPISHDERIWWVQADPLTVNVEPHLVPAEAVYLNLTRFTASRSHFPVVLAGIAAHRTRTEAETSALLEVIERDATMRWWYGGIPARRIVDIQEEGLTAVPEQAIEQWCLLLDDEFAYVVAGCLYDRTSAILTVGFAARHRIESAIRKAMAEAWQLRRVSLDLLHPESQLWADIRRGKFPFPTRGFREDRAYAQCFRADFLDMDQLAYNLQFFLDPGTHEETLNRLDGDAISSARLPPLCSDTPAAVRQHCLAQLERCNYRAFSIDLTTTDMACCGFRVVRVICPDLAGNAATAFVPLAHPRLATARSPQHIPRLYPLPHA